MSEQKPLTPASDSPLDAWLNYLTAIHPSEIDMGLERCQQVQRQAGLEHIADTVITVGGTNGKGSTVAYLEAILRAAGYRVGVYTSPHLVDYTERVRIDGKQLNERQHSEAFAFIEQARGDTSLTYFEFGTLAAFKLFQQQALDVVILEVGLGGRLDAVNMIAADVAVVTSIGIDHVEYLGPDRESIGAEKAGIFRADKVAICGDPEPPAKLLKVAAEKGAKLFTLGRDFSISWQQNAGHYQGKRWQLAELPLPRLPQLNVATALAALEHSELNVSAEHIQQGLQQAQLMGRMQRLHCDGVAQLHDVAHNPHAAAYLASQLRSIAADRPIYAVVGMLRDKDIAGTFAELTGLIERWYLGGLAMPRGATAEQLASGLKAAHVDTFSGVEEAYQAAVIAAQQDSSHAPLVLVFGSFYTVASVQALQRRQHGV